MNDRFLPSSRPLHARLEPDTSTTSRLERVVETDKRELERAWDELKAATRASLDPARPLASHRWAALAVSFGVGLWLGLRR
ncbi:MAG: hypothetical protein R3F62_27035 [Planctomycetota bacterium]